MSARDAAASKAPTFHPALGPGSRLGSYELVAPLRAGGMATLFLGRRVGPAGFARTVAIKVVHAHLANDPNFIEMFLDEARLAARIEHPNVVHTEELGEALGMYYLAMEYIRGCTLSQLLARLAEQKRVLAPELAAHIVMKLADGLHAAHEVKDEAGRSLGVVHRDVSPQNVLLSYDGQVKLIDFGVAKAAGRSRETAGGFLKGKISYMAPEQAWGRPIDRRTDVYALGIVLWECLTQRRLFYAADDVSALERVRKPDVRLPSTLRPAISLGLERAVLTALAVSPDERFQTAQEFRRAIGQGCAAAVLVEPETLAALLASTMAVEIAADEQNAAEISRTVNAARLDSSDVMSVPSTAAHGDASDAEPPNRERSERSTRASPVRRRSPSVRRWTLSLAALLLVLLGALGAWASATMRPSPSERASDLVAMPPPPTTRSPPMADVAVPVDVPAVPVASVVVTEPTLAGEVIAPVEPAALVPIARPISTAPRARRRAHLATERESIAADESWQSDEVAPLDPTEMPAYVFFPAHDSSSGSPALE